MEPFLCHNIILFLVCYAAGTRNRSFLLGQSLNTAVTFNPHCYRSVGEEFSIALKNRSVELTGNLQAFQNKIKTISIKRIVRELKFPKLLLNYPIMKLIKNSKIY